MAAYSGLQKEVVSLYRSFLRLAVQRKDGGAMVRVKEEFRKYQKSVNVRDIEQVEYLLRRAKNQLAMFRDSSVIRIGTWEPHPRNS